MEKYNYVALDEKGLTALEGDLNVDGQFQDKLARTAEGIDAELISDKTELKVRDINMGGYSIRHFQAEFNYDVVFSSHSDTGTNDFVTSCFLMDGQVTSLTRDLDKGVVVRKGAQNFMSDPYHDYSHRFAAHAPWSLLHFVLNRNYFVDFLPNDERWSVEAKERVARNETFIGQPFSTANATQLQAVRNILDNPMTGTLGKVMVESSFHQFMALHVKSLFHADNPPSQNKVTQRDRDVVHGVREYLVNNVTADHSLASLSRMFGVNETKLMRSFRLSFGQTIFDYLSEIKMTYAKSLLEEKGMFVSEAARTIGYKNPNHFSAAFKKRFGYGPSMLRKS